MIQLGVGGFNFIFEHQTSGCRDSIALNINCQTNPREEIIIIEEGESGTYCPEPDDLIGEIISIKNTCASSSGIAATINLDSIDFCMNYEGIKRRRRKNLFGFM